MTGSTQGTYGSDFIVLIIPAIKDIQEILNSFVSEGNVVELTISKSKTKILGIRDKVDLDCNRERAMIHTIETSNDFDKILPSLHTELEGA